MISLVSYYFKLLIYQQWSGEDMVFSSGENMVFSRHYSTAYGILETTYMYMYVYVHTLR